MALDRKKKHSYINAIHFFLYNINMISKITEYQTFLITIHRQKNIINVINPPPVKNSFISPAEKQHEYKNVLS